MHRDGPDPGLGPSQPPLEPEGLLTRRGVSFSASPVGAPSRPGLLAQLAVSLPFLTLEMTSRPPSTAVSYLARHLHIHLCLLAAVRRRDCRRRGAPGGGGPQLSPFLSGLWLRRVRGTLGQLLGCGAQNKEWELGGGSPFRPSAQGGSLSGCQGFSQGRARHLEGPSSSDSSLVDSQVPWVCSWRATCPTVLFSVSFLFSEGGMHPRHMEFLSQARGRMGAVAAGLHHSHSHTGSDPRLGPTPQLTAMPDP